MKYRDLIQFDPIETVVVIRDVEDARRLVRSYVISDEMAERLSRLLMPQLRFDQPLDAKALLVVGNYGTGKSHLMAVIAGVAEDAELLAEIQHPAVREAAAAVAGKFKVLRIEIGATKMPLREILTSELEAFLKTLGVDYTFPKIDAVTSNKDPLERMMERFGAVYPDHGLLVVVDELLDYLRSRRDQELILDLGFLREFAEICRDLRLRLIAGVQEAIFDSPRLAFAADSLKRVKDRFEQILIARNDVKYVVAERLLRKTIAQQQQIRAYLAPFTRFYGAMNERIDEFVRLFPVHPDYIDTFERVTFVEKREVLKTLSRAMSQLLEQDLPTDRPGLLAFDSYWESIKQNASFRAVPALREVIDISQMLESRVASSLPRAREKPLALRIVAALSVHRLTTADIYAAIGITPTELRDRLCLYDSLVAELKGDHPEIELLNQITKVLRDIYRSVNGQFLSENTDSHQFYLDLKKNEDYDAQIERRAESLSVDILDRYYFEVLKRVMECQDTTVATGYKIWQHEVIWQERQSGRSGYLFFGTPGERSTAMPPRDFYIYFLQPHQPPHFRDEKLADEVFLRLKHPDDDFSAKLRFFAAANDLALSAAGNARTIYQSRANSTLTSLSTWLQNNLRTAYELTYRGETRPLGEWLRKLGGRELTDLQSSNFRDTINLAAGGCLAPNFADQAPDYPRFTARMTAQNRATAAQDALRAIAGATRTRPATAVLDALGLMDADRIDVTPSAYAQHVRRLLQSRGAGQVVNRDDLLVNQRGVSYFRPQDARLEPEWLVVVLAALVASGDLVLSLPGRKFDATTLKELAATNLEELTNFKHIEAPKDWNVPVLKALFEALNLPSGLAVSVTQQKDEAVQQLQSELNRLVQRIVRVQQTLRDGIHFWKSNLLTDLVRPDLSDALSEAKTFFEAQQAFTTPGKLKNLRITVEEVQRHGAVRRRLDQIDVLRQLAADQSGATGWLTTAESVLPADHPWQAELQRVRHDVMTQISAEPEDAGRQSQRIADQLRGLKQQYMTEYTLLHRHARLDAAGGKRAAALRDDVRLKSLNELASIELMPRQQLLELQQQMDGLQSCVSLSDSDLMKDPVCPFCKFRPTVAKGVPAANLLTHLEQQLDTLLQRWTETVIANLDDPMTRAQLELLKPQQRAQISKLIELKRFILPPDPQLVNTIREVLAGLVRVNISADALFSALEPQAGPTTAAELRRRFDAYLQQRLAGKDAARVRIVLE